MQFTRSGVNGKLKVTADRFELDAKLGFLLGAFKERIESEIVKNLDTLLAGSKPAAKAAAPKATPTRRKPAEPASGIARAWVSFKRLDQVDVLLHRVVVARALQAVPGVPLGAADHVAEAGLLLGVVAGGGLLVQRVDLQQRGVVGPLRQLLGIGDGGFEVGFEVGHGLSPAGENGV